MIKKIFFLSIILIQQCYSDIILGVDLGSDYFKATVLKPGRPFLMVENVQSKTSTSSGVGFKTEERIFGPDTLIYKARFPKQVVNFVDRYLAEKHGSENLEKYIKDYFVSYDLTENKDRQSLEFNLKFKDEDIILSPEEIYGMLFRYVKFITEKFIGNKVDEVYVSVPSSWGYKKRHSLYQSVKLAGLNLKGIPTQNTAAAVQFMSDKNYNDTQYYIFYTMGASYTQASLVSLRNNFAVDAKNKTVETKEVNIIAEAWDDQLGGRDFDFNLVKHLMNKFDNTDQKKGKPSCSNDYKVPERILPSAIKYKEVLSSNKQVGINILGVESGMNLVSTLTKEEFEEQNNDLFARVYRPIEKLFEISGFKPENITQVEVLGGGVRIPKIQEILKEKLGENLIGAHMNGDDSISFGTAYIFANATKHFRVKKRVIANNGAPYELKIQMNPLINDENKDFEYCPEDLETIINDDKDKCIRNIIKNTTLYKIRHGFDISRTVAFKHDSDFTVEVNERMEGDDKETKLITFKVTGFKEAREELKKANIEHIQKVNLRFKLNEAGLLSLTSDIVYDTQLYFARLVDSEKNTTNYKYVADFVEPLNEEQLASELEILKAEGKNETSTEYVKIRNIGKTKKNENKINLKIEKEFTFPKPLTKEQFNKAKEGLDKLDRIENERLLNIEAKNTLESEIYARKEWIESDKARLFGKKEELENIETKIKEIYDWFDEEGYNADTETLKKKHQELVHPIVPIDNRKVKHEKRINAQDELEKEMFKIKAESEKLLETKPWIHAHYHETFIVEYTRIESWIDEKKIEHAKITLTDDPVVTADTYELRLKQIKREYQKMKVLPKPKEVIPVTNSTNSSNIENESTKEEASKDEATKEEATKEDATNEDTKNESTSEETKEEEVKDNNKGHDGDL